MIIAIVDNGGRLEVFNSATGRIVSGSVHSASEQLPGAPDRLEIAIGLLNALNEKVHLMSQTQDTVAAEVAALKSNMVDLHAGISGIQARLAAAIEAGSSSTDTSVLADLASINADLKTTIAGLASSAGASSASGSDTTAGAAAAPSTDSSAAVSTDPASAPQPAAPEETNPGVVFNAADATPNSPGGRNSSQLPNFDPSVAETA